jgi:hypothetical protein
MQREERISRLAQLKAKALGLAAIVGAPPKLLPRFGESNDMGARYVDYDGLYRLITQERGAEQDHRLTVDEDELMYWIFSGVTFEMASQYELAHRTPNQDSRRLLFKHQLHLLAKLSEKWKEKRSHDQEEILKRYPFKDVDPFADRRAE